MKQIDINCDVGEIEQFISDGTQTSLMPHLTSVNVACGGHAGDAGMMKATIEQALHWKVALGAHPGYPDRANFGRLSTGMPPRAVADTVFEQVSLFARVAASCGTSFGHVKPHGALYNDAVNDAELARAIAQGVARWSTQLVLIGLAGSRMLTVFRDAGFGTAAEAFADRRYEPDGTLRSRRLEDALISDPQKAARQVLQIVEQGTVTAVDGSSVPIEAQTICIHGDSPHAAVIAAEVARVLKEANVALVPFAAGFSS